MPGAWHRRTEWAGRSGRSCMLSSSHLHRSHRRRRLLTDAPCLSPDESQQRRREQLGWRVSGAEKQRRRTDSVDVHRHDGDLLGADADAEEVGAAAPQGAGGAKWRSVCNDIYQSEQTGQAAVVFGRSVSSSSDRGGRGRAAQRARSSGRRGGELQSARAIPGALALGRAVLKRELSARLRLLRRLGKGGGHRREQRGATPARWFAHDMSKAPVWQRGGLF